jgi:UDP-N-acetylmuramoyl-L-alanyl-D-glutamate--2,6-diaminopimelate ligase
MGAVAVSRADQVILTDDNPRSEDGDRIIADILAGCGTPHPQTIRDRRTAIRYALEQMSPGDWLVVAGKGHETTQEINGIKLPFSDRDVVLQWLKEAD